MLLKRAHHHILTWSLVVFSHAFLLSCQQPVESPLGQNSPSESHRKFLQNKEVLKPYAELLLKAEIHALNLQSLFYQNRLTKQRVKLQQELKTDFSPISSTFSSLNGFAEALSIYEQKKREQILEIQGKLSVSQQERESLHQRQSSFLGTWISYCTTGVGFPIKNQSRGSQPINKQLNLQQSTITLMFEARQEMISSFKETSLLSQYPGHLQKLYARKCLQSVKSFSIPKSSPNTGFSKETTKEPITQKINFQTKIEKIKTTSLEEIINQSQSSFSKFNSSLHSSLTNEKSSFQLYLNEMDALEFDYHIFEKPLISEIQSLIAYLVYLKHQYSQSYLEFFHDSLEENISEMNQMLIESVIGFLTDVPPDICQSLSPKEEFSTDFPLQPDVSNIERNYLNERLSHIQEILLPFCSK